MLKGMVGYNPWHPSVELYATDSQLATLVQIHK